MSIDGELTHIFRRIAELDILSCNTHKQVARWLSVHPIFTDEKSLKPVLYAQWTRLDRDQGYPRWRFQAAIEGNVHAFESVADAWVGLHQQFPIGPLTSRDSPPIELDPDVAEQHGGVAGYNRTVLLETRDRATYNKNISVNHPVFRTRDDEALYIDGLRQLLDYDGFVSQVTFLDILCVLCRDDGPMPVYDAGDSLPSPALKLMDLFLASVPDDMHHLSQLTHNTWKLISGTVHVHPRIFQRLWDHEMAMLSKMADEDERVAYMEELVDICVRSCFNGSYAFRPETAQDSAAGTDILYQYRVINWLCTNRALRSMAIGHIMGSAIYYEHTSICTYILSRYQVFTLQDIQLMTHLSRNRRYTGMMYMLADQEPKLVPEFSVVWSAQSGLWNWSAASQKAVFQLYGIAEEFARASISYHPENDQSSSSNSSSSQLVQQEGEKEESSPSPSS